jgi:hypothetical protein
MKPHELKNRDKIRVKKKKKNRRVIKNEPKRKKGNKTLRKNEKG